MVDKTWKVIDTGKNSAEKIMSFDSELLCRAGEYDVPILHLYDWNEDCATYGFFVKPFTFLNEKGLKKRGLQLAKRPTGGGILFHLTDFAFSVIVPSTHWGYSLNILENYEFINTRVKSVLETMLGTGSSMYLLIDEKKLQNDDSTNFCMANPTKYDVIIQGKKVAGAAQRRARQGYLHQGSIAIAVPPLDFLEDVLLPNTCVAESMKQNTFSLISGNCTKKNIEEVRKTIRETFLARFCRSESFFSV